MSAGRGRESLSEAFSIFSMGGSAYGRNRNDVDGTPGSTRTCDPRLRSSTNHTISSGKTGFMEKSWKVLEHIREGREDAAWESAQALARAVLEARQVTLAAAILQGGPHALRRALDLAEAVR